MLTIKKATRRQTKARICITGPTGSGKTKWALRIAAGLGKRIGVIDTENRSASLYTGDHGIEFDVIELDPDTEGGYDPRNYIDAIEMFERSGYDVIVIDSGTHAWSGTGGLLEQVDKSKSPNQFAAWKDATPLQNAFVDAQTHCKTHLITTLRSKMEYVLEEQTDRNGRKKQVPTKVGMAPIQRAGMEYEFSVIAECDLDSHVLKITKTRCSAIDGKAYAVGQVDQLARTLSEFHETGEEALAPAPAPAPAPMAAAVMTRAAAKDVIERQPRDPAADRAAAEHQSAAYMAEKFPGNFAGMANWSFSNPQQYESTPMCEAPSIVLGEFVTACEAIERRGGWPPAALAKIQHYKRAAGWHWDQAIEAESARAADARAAVELAAAIAAGADPVTGELPLAEQPTQQGEQPS